MYDYENKIKRITLPLIILTLIIVIGSCAMRDFMRKKDAKNTETKQLLSVALNEEINGAFILGTGNVNNKTYYVAYVIAEDGGKKLYKMPTDITTVYDTLNDNNSYCEVTTDDFGREVEIKLYVPEGTITQEYQLSLEK